VCERTQWHTTLRTFPQSVRHRSSAGPSFCDCCVVGDRHSRNPPWCVYICMYTYMYIYIYILLILLLPPIYQTFADVFCYISAVHEVQTIVSRYSWPTFSKVSPLACLLYKATIKRDFLRMRCKSTHPGTRHPQLPDGPHRLRCLWRRMTGNED